MEGMKKYVIEVTCDEKNDSKSDSEHRVAAEVSSRILLVLYSLIFVWVFGHTLYTINFNKNENVDAKNLTQLNLTTKQPTPNEEPALLFGYDADLVITNIASALAVAFSILLVVGIHKRSATMLLIWLTSAIALFGLPFLVLIFVWQGEMSFPKVLVAVIYMCLDYTLIVITSLYYMDMAKEGSEVKNTRKFRVTVAANPVFFTNYLSELVYKFSKSSRLSNEHTVCSITWREI